MKYNFIIRHSETTDIDIFHINEILRNLNSILTQYSDIKYSLLKIDNVEIIEIIEILENIVSVVDNATLIEKYDQKAYHSISKVIDNIIRSNLNVLLCLTHDDLKSVAVVLVEFNKKYCKPLDRYSYGSFYMTEGIFSQIDVNNIDNEKAYLIKQIIKSLTLIRVWVTANYTGYVDNKDTSSEDIEYFI